MAFLLMGWRCVSVYVPPPPSPPPAIEHRMLCLSGSSLDGGPFDLDLRLCEPVDRNDPRWACVSWRADTVYCECVLYDQVQDFKSGAWIPEDGPWPNPNQWDRPGLDVGC